jgi:hypothetical protein
MRKIASIFVSFFYLAISLVHGIPLAEHWVSQSLIRGSGPTVEYPGAVHEFRSSAGDNIAITVFTFAKPLRFTDANLITTGKRLRLQCTPSNKRAEAKGPSESSIRPDAHTSACREPVAVDLTASDAKSLLRVLQTRWDQPAAHSKTIRWQSGDLGAVANTNEKAELQALALSFRGATVRFQEDILSFENALHRALEELR